MSKVTVLSAHRRGPYRLEAGEVVQALRELGGVAHVSLIIQRVLSRHLHLDERERGVLREQVATRLTALERAPAGGQAVRRVFGETSNRWTLAPTQAPFSAVQRRAR